VEYRWVAGGLAGLNEAVAIGVASGAGPDISYVSGNTIMRLTHGGLHAGLAEPIDDFLAQSGLDRRILPPLLEMVRYDNKTFGVPFIMWPIMEVYNLDLFESAGVAEPTTWAEQLDATRRLTRVNAAGAVEQWGYQGPSMTAVYAFYLLGRTMEQLGRRLIEPEADRGSLTNAEAQQAMYYLHDLYRLGMPDGRAGIRFPQILENKVAAFHGSLDSNLMNSLSTTNLRLEFRRFVKPAGGTDIVQCNVGTLYLLSTSKNKPEALRVLEAFMQPNNLKGYYMAAPHWQPVLQVHFTDADILSRPYTKGAMRVLTEPITTYGPKHPLLTEMYPSAGAVLAPAILGQTPIESALEEAERLMNAAIAEHRRRD
jgi:ABC-type glycerol-3-phosphate transport system substrate-binding protein